MCGLSVVCSRGGSGETSKTRRCVGLAIQRSLIRVHKSFFFSHFPLLTWPTSLPTAIWESLFSKYYCKMNVFDFDLQENYFLNVTTPSLSDLLPDLSHLSH